MGTLTRMEPRKISELHPYERNAKLHPPEQIEKLRASFREFGMIVPIGIDQDANVIYGHGRLMAAQAEGWTEVPTVTIENLTDEQRQAFVHADNLLSETGYDKDLLRAEAQMLQAAGFDVSLVGFDACGITLGDDGHFWDEEGESSEEYEEFTEKFKPKLTTDDCYTPPNIYEAVKRWAVENYRLGSSPIIRPFYPGADYTTATYPDGCVVIDNPPFSILSQICRWYQEHGVRFFLFVPALTCFSIASGEMNYLPVGCDVMYENGASVSTSFVTNLGDYKIETPPELFRAVDQANDENLRAMRKDLPKYSYPVELCCVQMNTLAKYGQHLRIPATDCAFVRALDAQRDMDKAIFGGGFLLSFSASAEKAAAEKAAAEKAAAHRWPLSERERELIATLGRAPEVTDGEAS